MTLAAYVGDRLRRRGHPRLHAPARSAASRFHRHALGDRAGGRRADALLQPLTGDIAARHGRRAPAGEARRDGRRSSRPRPARRCASAAWPDAERRRDPLGDRDPRTACACSPTTTPNAEVHGPRRVPARRVAADARRPRRVPDHGRVGGAAGAGRVVARCWLACARRRLPDRAAGSCARSSLAAPLGFIAIEAGWTVTEVGRQPWIVYGVMRTARRRHADAGPGRPVRRVHRCSTSSSARSSCRCCWRQFVRADVRRARRRA